MKNAIKLPQLLTVLFSFFVMGFVDIVGISTSYVKQDFDLNDKLANLLPFMVFLWFAVFSLPIGSMMGKTGRKKMVLISATITFVSMLIPAIHYSFLSMIVAFTLLGIGNTILQVSLNPLLTDIVDGNKITSMLSLGSFIKAIASTLGPLFIAMAAGFGNWTLIFPVYALFTLLSFIWLQITPIQEKQELKMERSEHKIVSLLKNKTLLIFLSIIILIVGFEIGLITTIPKYFQERFSLPLDRGAFACSTYYMARTIGMLTGSILLAKIASRKFILTTLTTGILFFGIFLLSENFWLLMISLFIIGFACANVFPIVFSCALQVDSSKTNEISALMITGVAGGALIPFIMGVIADGSNQLTSLFVPLAALVYILISSFYYIKLRT